jgi:FkbM family methyltransferase
LIAEEVVTSSEVVAAYHLLLGREPESSEVVVWHVQRARNVHELVRNFMWSQEFRTRYAPFFYPDVWVWSDSDLGFRIRVNLRDEGVSKHVIENQFERREAELIRSLLKSGDVALDLGGNIGYFTLLMAKIVGSGGRVHSIEARPDLADSIEMSVQENQMGQIVTVHRVAVADRAEQAFMIYAASGTNFGGAYLSFTEEPPPGHVAIPVRVSPLGELLSLPRLNFIKADIEGAEPRALATFADQLKRLRPIILSEVHPGLIRAVSGVEPEQFVKDICDLGYTCRLADGQAVPSQFDDGIYNVLFTPREI